MNRIRTICALLLLGFLAMPAWAQSPDHPGNQHAQPAHGTRHSSGHSGAWLRKYRDMSPQEQEKALTEDPEFKRLSPEGQQKLRQRLQHFNSLPPEQKERIVRRMEVFGNLTPEQRKRARELQAKLSSVPQDRRAVMRSTLHDLRQMSPEDRQKVMASEQFHSTFNDHEREILQGLAELPIGRASNDTAQPAPRSPPQ